MALQTSGAISLNDLHVEVGGTSGTTCSLNDPDIRALIDVGDSAVQSLQQYYGQSSETSLPTSGSTINGQAQLKEITASTYISSGGTLIVPSNLWVWSDNINRAALIIDVPCTVNISGKVIGRGGDGGWYTGSNATAAGSATNGEDGGDAISITSSGVSIILNSGGYIAGGGGGGGGGWYFADTNNVKVAGGGGGAGGGSGGGNSGIFGRTENGGALNAEGGSDGSGDQRNAWGGGAGGGGGHGHSHAQGGGRPGGGGGRILPGVGGYYSGFHSTNYSQNWSGNSNGHTGATGNSASGGAGGSAGNAGNNAGISAGQYAGSLYNGGGGGGGWGAAGGRGRNYNYSVGGNGGSGGKAIEKNGNSYSLTNNGTIYGST